VACLEVAECTACHVQTIETKPVPLLLPLYPHKSQTPPQQTKTRMDLTTAQLAPMGLSWVLKTRTNVSTALLAPTRIWMAHSLVRRVHPTPLHQHQVPLSASPVATGLRCQHQDPTFATLVNLACIATAQRQIHARTALLAPAQRRQRDNALCVSQVGVCVGDGHVNLISHAAADDSRRLTETCGNKLFLNCSSRNQCHPPHQALTPAPHVPLLALSALAAAIRKHTARRSVIYAPLERMVTHVQDHRARSAQWAPSTQIWALCHRHPACELLCGVLMRGWGYVVGLGMRGGAV